MLDLQDGYCKDVSFDADGYYVSDRSGERHHIQVAGARVRAFNSGWVPLFLYTGLPGQYLLELAHTSGRSATWYLDEKLIRLCDAVSDLPTKFHDALVVAAFKLRADIWTQLMLAAKPMLHQATRDLFKVNGVTRAQVLAALQESAVLKTKFIDISSYADTTLNCSSEDRQWLLQRHFLQEVVQAPIRELFIAASNTGILRWPSPVDGLPMRLLGGLFLDDFRFAYRMLDERSGLVVVVVVAEHHARTIAVFLPQAGLIVVPSGNGVQRIETLFGQLAQTLEKHLWDHALVLEHYFTAESFAFASVLRGPPGLHLGHQLWNELSGIEDVVRLVRSDRLPNFLVPNAGGGTEVYGPLDVLFPELGGRVLRFDKAVGAIVPEAYTRHLCVTRITGEHVSARLRSRISALAHASTAGREACVAAEAVLASGLPIVVIGLRVENRTVTDLPSFLIALIERMVAHIGAAVFVIDGHNRRLEADPDAMFVSHWEHAATSRPQDVERDIVGILDAHFADTEARIVSTIGAPISTSLIWSSHSRMFFAIWGAGLAKYRWVANTPGFVLSSAHNLMYRNDLNIYDNPTYMDNPTQLVFANPACVTDRPDQRPVVIPTANLELAYVNFEVDMEALWPQVEAFMKSLSNRDDRSVSSFGV